MVGFNWNLTEKKMTQVSKERPETFWMIKKWQTYRQSCVYFSNFLKLLNTNLYQILCTFLFLKHANDASVCFFSVPIKKYMYTYTQMLWKKFDTYIVAKKSNHAISRFVFGQIVFFFGYLQPWSNALLIRAPLCGHPIAISPSSVHPYVCHSEISCTEHIFSLLGTIWLCF